MRTLPAPLLLTLCLILSACGPNSNSSHDGSSTTAYPGKTVTLVCPWAAGGGTDRLSRFFADQLEKRLGKPCVVANKTGGSGAVGHSAVALAKPDGHTLIMATFELSTMHWMGISDLTCQDFEAISQVNADAAAIIVRADAPWKSLTDFLDHIRMNPGQLKMSGTATGGAWDLARAGFLLAADLPVQSVLWVPTQGAAPSLVELLGGHIDAVCCSLPEAASQIEAGQLKVLTIMAPSRHTDFPEVQTAQEAGINWEAVGWRGLMAPKGTPPAIVETLSAQCRDITESPEFKSFMKKNGFAIEVRTSTEFAAFLQTQDAQWKNVIEAAGYSRQ